MTQRDRRQRRGRAFPSSPVDGLARIAPPPPPGPSEPGLRERLANASPAERALLPVRFFFGLTFVYAGLDKLLDPTFFDAANAGSIVGQLQAFARVSPLAPMVRLAEPFAVPIGLLIALAEIAIGLGALTGLAFRLAAAGGAALSFLFWLTASWTTTPYYYGADLPYAMGWVALAIAGTGDLLVSRRVREMGSPALDAWDRARLVAARGGHGGRPPAEVSPERRLVLQAGALAGLSLVVASLAAPVRFLRGPSAGGDLASGGGPDGGTDGAGGSDPSLEPGATPTAATAGEPTPTTGASGPATTPSGLTVASIATVDAKGAVRIRIPADAPAPLPAGDPGIVVRLQDGSYACYDAVCTHEGCRVGWDARDQVMVCPCHGAAFDPNDHGAVLGGPTNQPLPELPIVIDHQAGTITLKA